MRLSKVLRDFGPVPFETANLWTRTVPYRHHGPRATCKQIVRNRSCNHDCLRSVCLRLFKPAQHHHGRVRYPHGSVWFPPVYRTESVRYKHGSLRSRGQKQTENPQRSRITIYLIITTMVIRCTISVFYFKALFPLFLIMPKNMAVRVSTPLNPDLWQCEITVRFIECLLRWVVHVPRPLQFRDIINSCY